MRKVREVLRLRHALGLSYREISEALRVGKNCDQFYTSRHSIYSYKVLI
jgi:hypothetical protein